MGLTLSHATALSVLRDLRARGIDVRTLDRGSILRPSSWTPGRWRTKDFDAVEWKWPKPDASSPLHSIVRESADRLRMAGVRCHTFSGELPANSIIWLDPYATTSGPEFIFVQMANTCTFVELVLLGYELCGNFTRNAANPKDGLAIDNIPPATSVTDLRSFVWSVGQMPGLGKARRAVELLANNALSVPEAILATFYSLPREEYGYGMGPVGLNERVAVSSLATCPARSRYPDLMFSFAPIGINYDGEEHLDLSGLVRVARRPVDTQDADAMKNQLALINKMHAVRRKAVDDIRRNRQLAARGRIVLPATKEDLYERNGLDDLTRSILSCARRVFGVDTRCFEESVEDSSLCEERYCLLSSLLPRERDSYQATACV